jgi:hypothetical protein
MKVTFRNDSYLFTHGKAPKGVGMWIFEVVFSDQLGTYSTGERIFATGTFTDAKRQAKQLAVTEARTVGACREVFLDIQG